MRTGLAIALIAALGLAVPSAARADACSASDGATLTAKLADPTCDSISLAAGTYASASGFTAPARTVAIFGPGSSFATITRTGAGNVVTVPTGATFSISGVTLGGATSGAGLSVTGTGIATMTNSIVGGNASTANGAGIAFSGMTLTVSNTLITGNSTTGNGGGAENSGTGTATFHEVLFTQNTATGSGGGGGVDTAAAAATTNLENVTLTANHANVDGGAVRSGTALATTNLNNVTIAGNEANSDNSGGGDGGGVSNSGGTLSVGNSILANNTALGGGAPDCDSVLASPLTRTGYELIRDVTGCTLGGVGDTATGYQTGVDPLLSSLGSFGGTLQSMALLPGSPAVNAGNPAAPTGTGGTCQASDQRSRSRSTPAVDPCDLGAFEVQPPSCHNIVMTIGIGQATPVALGCTGDPFTYAIASAPLAGALSGFNATTGAVTYTPNAGFTGTDSFTYNAVNGPVSSSVSSVTLSVRAPASPTPNQPGTHEPGFDVKAAIKRCKRKVPKGPKRAKCITKAKKRGQKSP